jgi:hypothetical protein
VVLLMLVSALVLALRMFLVMMLVLTVARLLVAVLPLMVALELALLAVNKLPPSVDVVGIETFHNPGRTKCHMENPPCGAESTLATTPALLLSDVILGTRVPKSGTLDKRPVKLLLHNCLNHRIRCVCVCVGVCVCARARK